MKSNQTRVHLLSIAIMVVSWSIPFQIKGALPVGMEETLELRINSEIEKILQELVTEKQVCEELWLTWPIEAPKNEISDMKKEINDLVGKKSEAMFPFVVEEEIEEEAAAKYDLFDIGELVNFKLKDGNEVRGYLRVHKNTEILIDNRTIKLADIKEEEIAHFDPIIREIKMKEYVRSKLADLKEKRFDYEQKIKDEVSEQLYVDFGYVKVKDKWIAKKELVTNRMNDHKEKLKEKLKPLLRTKMYYDKGFVFFDNEWITKEEADNRRQQRLKKEAEKAKALKLETLETADEGGEEDDKESLWE